MSEYTVHWEIDLDAETPYEAAQRALEIQRDPQSIATMFIVEERGGRAVKIDFNPND